MDTTFKISENSRQPENYLDAKSFTKADLGKLDLLKDFVIENNDFNLKNTGKVFLHELLNLTGAEISLNSVPGKYKAPFKHAHKQNEEIFIFIKGNGAMEIDGERFNVSEGSTVRIAPSASRYIENNDDEQMIFVVVQVRANSLEGYTLTDAEIL